MGVFFHAVALAACCIAVAHASGDPELAVRYGRPSMYATFEGQRVITFAGVANNSSLAVEQHNGALLNETLASLQPGDVFVIPNNTYYTMGGVLASNLTNVTISFEGTLVFSTDMKAWPRSTPGSKGKVLECLEFQACSNIRFVGQPGGTVLDGNGATWWGFPGIGYLLIGASPLLPTHHPMRLASNYCVVHTCVQAKIGRVCSPSRPARTCSWRT